VRRPDLVVPATPPADVECAAALRRRRLTATVTVPVGAALLAATLRVPRGSTSFTVLGLLVAATWIAGALVSGPIQIRPRATTAVRTVVAIAVGVGVASFLVFLGAYVIAQHLPMLSAALDGVLGKADAGPVLLVLAIALVNAVGEELFFRGALHAALEPHRAGVFATLIYVAVTATAGNLALVAAAAVMGTVFVLERLSTRSVLASVVTHVVWSTLILIALPR
jgi:membrane protease YdiL (CAAX protease family)